MSGELYQGFGCSRERHNLLLRCDDLSFTAGPDPWGKNSTPTLNGFGTNIIGPGGQPIRVSNFTSSLSGMGYFEPGIPVVSGAKYTCIAYVRVTGSAGSFQFGPDSSVVEAAVTFDCLAGTFSTGPALKGAINLGTNTWMLWAVFTTTTTTMPYTCYPKNASSNVWDFAGQLHLGTVPQEYIRADATVV